MIKKKRLTYKLKIVKLNNVNLKLLYHVITLIKSWYENIQNIQLEQMSIYLALI